MTPKSTQPVRRELPTYLVVSGCAMALDVGILLLLVKVIGISEMAAAGTGYLAGLALHYAFSIRFVFSQRRFRDRKHIELSFYLLTGLLGATINATAIQVMANAGMGLLVSKACAATGIFVLIFFLRKAVLFTDYSRKAG